MVVVSTPLPSDPPLVVVVDVVPAPMAVLGDRASPHPETRPSPVVATAAETSPTKRLQDDLQNRFFMGTLYIHMEQSDFAPQMPAEIDKPLCSWHM